MISSKDYLQELSMSELEKKHIEHDCHLSEHDGCEVCNKYFKRINERAESEICEDCGEAVIDGECSCTNADYRPRPEQVYQLLN